MIIIGVPTTGSIPIKVIGCIENVLLSRKDVYPYYVEGSLVYDARCKIVNYCREKGADLLFLDSDICFPLEGFDRLIERNADIVSGLYYGRNPDALPIAYKTVRPQTWYRKKAILEPVDYIPEGGYFEIEGAGLGFCLIKNRVLNSLPDKINPFEPFGNIGEDFSFFCRLRKKGYKVMLDTTFELKHLGEYAYTFRDNQKRSDSAEASQDSVKRSGR